MFKKSKICTGVLLALAASMPAMAQEVLQRVEITGSRIKTLDVEGQSPIVVLSAEAIKVDGVRTAEGVLNSLPQVFADMGGGVSNGASGTATVNLRNLGSTRTLVLVNGRRMPAGSPRSLAADLNQIPVSMIKRVEVLTGGASAVYGSDAVAGVVNFILNDNFQGVEMEGTYSFYNHQQNNAVADVVRARNFALPGDKSADGIVKEFSLTLGGNFADNKGNATINFTAHKENPLLQSERDFSACALGASGDKFTCGGSSTSFPGRFITANGNRTVADAAGNVRPWTAASDLYNYAPLNYFQRPADRYSMTALARYDINEKARVYAQLAFHDDHTVAQIAPSGLFGFDASGANAITFENPLLSQAWKNELGLAKAGDTADVFILRRNVEGGGRQDDIRHTSYRAVIGVKGDVGAWSYDAFGQVARVVYQETYKNDFSMTRAARAMDVVSDGGKAVCRSVVNGSDPNCVPYDIWSLGKITPEALAYLQTPGFQKGFTNQQVFGASVSGDLSQYGMKMPSASSGVGVAVGLERRVEQLDLSTDTAFTTGDLFGQGGPTLGVAGRYTVDDIFGELRVPLIDRKPMAYSLNVNASYRHSKYSTGHNTDTYGTGIEWSPVKTVKFRGSAQQAVRAANIVELYTGQYLGLYNMDEDPCAGANPSASLAKCALTGVSAAQYGSIPDSTASQYNAIFGGNPNLKPETAKSFTLGVVANPMKDLTVSVDYFKIKLDDAISTLPSPTVISKCLETGDAKYCGLIQRDKLGSLWATPDANVMATNLNIASQKTDGFDLGLDYSMKLGAMGKLDISFLGTVLNDSSSEPIPGDGSYNCAGYYGSTCGTPQPKWRHKLRGSWATPWGVNAALTWRHFDGVSVDTSSSSPLLAGTVHAITAKLPAMDYLDVTASYKLSKNVTLNAGINNLLDKDPPVANTGAPFGNGNTYPVVYDALGRRVTLSLNAKF